MEAYYLNLILDQIPAKGNVLDLGCGTGEPFENSLWKLNLKSRIN